jgi:uncharacterized protein (TIGR03083 family)
MQRDPHAWIATLRNSHERLASVVAPLTPEDLRSQSYDTEWTVAQVLSHIGSGAEIALMMMPGALGQSEPVGPEAFRPVWDTWNAKSPDEQAADALVSDEKYVRQLEELSNDDLASISLPFVGRKLDSVGLVGLRLGEHALHTWDVAVSFDPAATVSADAVALLIDNVPGFLVPRIGKVPDVPFRARIRTTDPERDYLLVAADPITMTDWPGNGADFEVTMPSEALLRLSYGRLDPEHTPAAVQADQTDLERLRRMLPGF